MLEVQGLRKVFSTGSSGPFGQRRDIVAVDDATFDIAQGRTLGLVGESGCGKTTTGRLILRLIEPTAGHVRLEGIDLMALDAAGLRAMRRRMQIVFQDPFGALNPRMTAGELVLEPMVVHGVGDGVARERRLRRLMDMVGLPVSQAGRFPHEFSGGQRQRICIARALALEPSLLVCDEAVSALDVSVQAQVLNLLADLRADLGLTYLFISHDLGVVRHISDEVAVMYLGRIVEIGPKRAIFDSPAHPYTQALLASVPSVAKGRRSFFTIEGEVPSAASPPPGCRFHTRCPIAVARCAVEPPALRPMPTGQSAACHLAGESR